jgi:hypothetical protein
LAAWRAGEIAEVDGHGFVFGMEFVFDGGEGAEDQVARVGHDGGAARVDATFDLELEEAGEELVERDGGGEIGETVGEIGGRSEPSRRMGREAECLEQRPVVALETA